MAIKKEKNKRVPLEIIALVFVFFAFLFLRGSMIAAAGIGSENLAGFAWSSNFGWISFNCNNLPAFNTCAVADYGVGINPANNPHPFNLDGYAWSSNAGWISFRDSNPPDYKFNTNCNARSTCDSLSNPPCTACYNPDNGKIFGWAKAVNLGNDGWISLGTSSVNSTYQVSVDQTSASGTLTGFAWNGSSDFSKGLGWIRFNCRVPGYVDQCATSSYFVYLKSSHLPAATVLKAPQWPYAEACAAPGAASGVALNAELGWTFTDPDPGSAQTAFQVLLSTSPTTSTAPLLDTGKRSLTVSQYLVATTGPDILNYSTAYYWWVRVWDDFGFVSPWHKFDTSLGDNLTENNSNGNPQTFTTYKHKMPDAYFNYLPALLLAYYPVTSTDASVYYTSADPTIAQNCTQSTCSWLWSGDNALSNSTPSASTSVLTFSYGGNANIKLNVTDPDGYACGTSSPNFFVDLLPNWKEKQAQ